MTSPQQQERHSALETYCQPSRDDVAQLPRHNDHFLGRPSRPFVDDEMSGDEFETQYTIMNHPPRSFTLTVVPTASAYLEQGYGSDLPHPPTAASAYVFYKVTPTPVTIDFHNSTRKVGGVDYILSGQLVDATLDAGSYTVDEDSYLWSTVAASAFADFNPTLAHDQYLELTEDDCEQSFFEFYTAKTESANVRCQAEIDLPNGAGVLNINVTKRLDSLLPTMTSGMVTSVFVNNSPDSIGAGETWPSERISVPSPFSGGTGCFAQILTSVQRTITRNPLNGKTDTYTEKMQDVSGNWILIPTAQGVLDGAYPYPYGFKTDSQGQMIPPTNPNYTVTKTTFDVSEYGYSSDGPMSPEHSPDVDGGGENWAAAHAADSFETYLMYKPLDGGAGANTAVWVPLATLNWSWSGVAGKGFPNYVWTVSSSNATPGSWSAADGTDFPEWAAILTSPSMRP